MVVCHLMVQHRQTVKPINHFREHSFIHTHTNPLHKNPHELAVILFAMGVKGGGLIVNQSHIIVYYDILGPIPMMILVVVHFQSIHVNLPFSFFKCMYWSQ